VSRFFARDGAICINFCLFHLSFTLASVLRDTRPLCHLLPTGVAPVPPQIPIGSAALYTMAWLINLGTLTHATLKSNISSWLPIWPAAEMFFRFLSAPLAHASPIHPTPAQTLAVRQTQLS
jgi:hypothetical protein